MNETAWSSWDEWRLVYSQFYSSRLEDKAEACRRVNAWTLRGPRLPLPMRDTLSLVEALLLEHDPAASFEQVRLSMAMGLVRMVNHAADDGQRGDYAQSIANLAVKVGLPKWLVDVRHESTHQALPSLQVLKLACNQALKWIEENYWQRQWDEHSKSHSNRLDARMIDIAECIDRGAIQRDVGPSLPVTAAASSSKAASDPSSGEGEEVVESSSSPTVTAQDIVDLIKEYSAPAIARSLFKAMILQRSTGEDEEEEDREKAVSTKDFDWTRWERVLHWLDETSLRVCKPLVLVCISEALKPQRSLPELKRIHLLLRGLMSRRYNSFYKASIAKQSASGKTLTIDTSDSWSKSERVFMNGFAAEIFRPQVLAGVKKCLALGSPQAEKLLKDILLPYLLASSKSSTSSSSAKKQKKKSSAEDQSSSLDDIVCDVETLFRLRQKIDKMQGRENAEEEDDEDDTPADVMLTMKDFETLSKFCETQETVASSSSSVPAASSSSSTAVNRPIRVEEIARGGTQEWAPVVWPGLPVGALVDDAKLCPGLGLVPPPFEQDMVNDFDPATSSQDGQDLQRMEDQSEAGMMCEVEHEDVEIESSSSSSKKKTKQKPTVDVKTIVVETAKKVRLLL